MAEILCPEDCEVALPIQEFDKCNPQINLSQITDILIAKGDAAPFEDVADPVEWAARLSQTDVTAGSDKIRRLTGIGSKAKPGAVTRALSKGRNVVINRNHSLNFKLDETNQANYDAMREHQCGGIYTIWYITAGNNLFGGNNGIKVGLEAGPVLAESEDEIEILDYIFDWKNKFSEERVVSPI